MAQYVVTGRPIGQDLTTPPWNVIGPYTSVGGTITLSLSAGDEAKLFSAGILEPLDATLQHTYLR